MFYMGGGKRKFNQVKKFVPKDKKLGKFVAEEKKEHNKDDVKELLNLWSEMRKKDKKEESNSK